MDPTIRYSIMAPEKFWKPVSYIHNKYHGFRQMDRLGFPDFSIDIYGNIIQNVFGWPIKHQFDCRRSPDVAYVQLNEFGIKNRLTVSTLVSEMFWDTKELDGPFVENILLAREFYLIPKNDIRLTDFISKTGQRYWITRFGDVWTNWPKIKLVKHDIGGYQYALISDKFRGGKCGKSNNHYLLHRLVAQYFIPIPERFLSLCGISIFDLQVNHKDGNKHNNRWDNLEWVSAQENVIHSFNTKLRSKVSPMPEHVARTILQLSSEGKCPTEISKIVGVSISSVSSLCRGKIKSLKYLLKEYSPLVDSRPHKLPTEIVQTILRMFYVDGYSRERIATELNMKYHTVKRVISGNIHKSIRKNFFRLYANNLVRTEADIIRRKH